MDQDGPIVRPGQGAGVGPKVPFVTVDRRDDGPVVAYNEAGAGPASSVVSGSPP